MAKDDVLLKSFVRSHPLEAARAIERLPEKLTAATLEEMDAGFAARLFEHMSASQAARNILLMQTSSAAEILEAMSLRDAGRLMRKLSPAQVENLLARVKAKTRLQLARQLRYPAETVAAMMNPRVFTLPNDITVAYALKRVERDNDMFACDLYLVDVNFKPVGVMLASALLRAGKKQRIASLANSVPPMLPASASLGAVREMAAWQDFQSLPVVEKDGTLIGTLHLTDIQQEETSQTVEADTYLKHTTNSLLELCWIGMAELMDMVLVRNHSGSGRGRS